MSWPSICHTPHPSSHNGTSHLAYSRGRHASAAWALDRGADLKASAEEEITELFKLSAQALRALAYLGADEEEVTPELLAQYFTDLDLRDALGDAERPGVPDVMRKLITQAVILVAVSVLTSGLHFAATLLSVVQAVMRPGNFEECIATLAQRQIAAKFRASALPCGKEVRTAGAAAFQDVRTKLQQGMDNLWGSRSRPPMVSSDFMLPVRTR